jgi:hypothetical protein
MQIPKELDKKGGMQKAEGKRGPGIQFAPRQSLRLIGNRISAAVISHMYNRADPFNSANLDKGKLNGRTFKN